jgi:uncharacterized membrane protein
MQIPLHPMIVHFPLALSAVMPILMIVFLWLMKKNLMAPKCWLIIIGLQLFTTVSAYIALESGEEVEDKVEKVVDKKLIHTHEEKAEIFTGVSVLALVLSIVAYVVKKELQTGIILGLIGISMTGAILGFNTGKAGGELVYEHGAAGVFADKAIPAEPVIMNKEEVSESLKADDNDYSGTDEEASPESDDEKEED